MKKTTFLIFLFCLAAAQCFSQIKASAKTGFITTQIKEIVWNETGKNQKITSLLDWQTFYAPAASANLEFRFFDYFFAGADGLFTTPVLAGTMQDSDYMNIFTTGSTERTHYSKHDNKLNNYYFAAAYLGAGYNILDELELSALVSFKYAYYSFTAWNGYKQYGSDPKTPMEGKIITFQAEKMYLGGGLRANYKPTQKLSFTLNATILPTISIKALDTHYRRSSPYIYFVLKNELAFDSSVLLEYNIRRNLALTAGFDFFVSSVKNGTLLQSADKEDWNKASNPGGIKECTGRFELGFTYIYEN